MEYLDPGLLHLHPDTAVEYHTQCIKHLASLAEQPQAIYDDNLLAASVVLRLYEELDGVSFILNSSKRFI